MISVIIPFYNRKNFLRQAIESVLAQTLKDWQLLLIDDGSTDGATQLAQNYASSDSRIIYLKRPANSPKGAPTCRNIGIENARGEFLMFLDSDDLLLPYCLEQRLNATKKFPGFDGWIFQVAKVKNEELRVKSGKFIEFGTKGLELKVWNTLKAEPVIQFLQIDSPWHTSGGLWRTTTIKQKNIRFDPNLAVWQDVDFHLQVLSSGLKLKILLNDYPSDVIYRIHSQTISQKAYPTHYRKSQIYFFEKWLSQLQTPYKTVLKNSFEKHFNSLLNKGDIPTLLTLLKIKSPLLTPAKKIGILTRLPMAAFKKVYNKLANL